MKVEDVTSALEIAKEVISKEGLALLSLSEKLGPGFAEAVEGILKTKGRVIVSGVGKSGIAANKIAATFTSTGTPSFFIHPVEAVHGDLGLVTSEDTVLFVSKSGESDELCELLPVVKRLGPLIICITESRKSSLGRACNIVIETGRVEEACPFDLVPTTSTTAALALGDALAIALLRKRGLKKEDFAFFHPGGAIGRIMRLRVGDIMRKGDEVPIVTEDETMKGAILEIMKKRLGVTTVVDREGKLTGIVTDGDIKRILVQNEDIMKLRVGDVKTVGPRTIGEDELVATAVRLMEDNAPGPITSLVVVDEHMVPVGLLHMHDCLKARQAPRFSR